MSFLIAIMTCHDPRFRARADVLRRTWVPAARGLFDVRFFLGRGGSGEPAGDEVWLDCPDDYHGLRAKVQAMFRWSSERAYGFTFKTDDDVYVMPDRLSSYFPRRDYSGRVRGPSRENDAPRIYGAGEANFCSGFGYVLSQRAAQIAAGAPDNGDWAEDRFVGQALARAGVTPVHDGSVQLWPPMSGHICTRSTQNCAACVQQYHGVSVLCPHARPDLIEKLHEVYTCTGGFIPTWLD